MFNILDTLTTYFKYSGLPLHLEKPGIDILGKKKTWNLRIFEKNIEY